MEQWPFVSHSAIVKMTCLPQCGFTNNVELVIFESHIEQVSRCNIPQAILVDVCVPETKLIHQNASRNYERSCIHQTMTGAGYDKYSCCPIATDRLDSGRAGIPAVRSWMPNYRAGSLVRRQRATRGKRSSGPAIASDTRGYRCA